ncbi:MAG: S-adenosyl-L-methionine-dependent methyltransferase [Benjaminiella poitrasii]|nr:MAG: S-adenosyl-L-methionine-dependent methyltransferase [Benjaminiella poitrasii]
MVNHRQRIVASFFFSILLASSNLSTKELLTAEEQLNNKLVHRVKISNLPTHELASIRKLLQSFDIYKYKKAPQWDYAYLNFEKVLSAEYSKIHEKSLFRRHNITESKEQKELPKIEDTRTPAEKLADQVTCLHRMPYHEQIAKKHKLGARFLNSFRKKLNSLQDITDIGRQQIAWTNTINDMHCEILDIIQSPSIYEYRTKCEFTIGTDLKGEKTVGFLLGLYKNGITAISSPNECLHVSKKAKGIAKAMETYVRQSEYDVYDRSEKRGVWRSIMTRTQRTGDTMILIQINSQSLTEDQLLYEKEKLINYWSNFFSTQEYHDARSTLMLQVWNGVSNGITDKGITEVLIGDGYVYEELLGYRFRISSNAFFQINTPATELLYAKCAEWCKPNGDKKTTLLDLCCGTGTIGITMANSVNRVIGIEMVSEAIMDAKENAMANNVKNIEFYAGKVEDKLDVVAKENNEEIVAVLDPPRSGVHNSVIRAIRESPTIKKVIFISCDAKQAMQNFIGLCRPTSNRFKESPFRPSRALSVDLFPHTDHCELMIEFVRS